ncbi:hypothetical protein [Neptunicella sp. SCSIO 80796]|uniref:hypothetical protein n=1 Tax=Neptunicella plasticusilytica TaxID=3117012 RepID=UPI003A4E06A0
MKYLIVPALALSALTATVSAETNVTTSEGYKLVGDMKFSSFCKAVLNDDVLLLKHSLARKVGSVASSRRDVLRKLIAEDGMTCDGASLVDFAKQREATEVHAYILQQS